MYLLPNKRTPFFPELFNPTKIAVPTIVGRIAKMIGVMRSFRRSEYHPHAKVTAASTAPVGVDKIRVCLDLGTGDGFYVYPIPLIMRLLTMHAYQLRGVPC